METARLRVYLEATFDSSVEVRDLAEDGLVHFPLTVSTDDGEVRELSSLKEPRKLLGWEVDSIGGFKTSEVVRAYLNSDWDRRTTTLGSSTAWASTSAAGISGEGIVRMGWSEVVQKTAAELLGTTAVRGSCAR